MKQIFPDPVLNLPLADMPLQGAKAWLSQSENHQIMFMVFEDDVEMPEHAHAAQAGFVLEGAIELTIAGEKRRYLKGDRYYIPEGVRHSGKIYAGYSQIVLFNEKDRYAVKK
jgi:quercetin dioxygenase-like cupin family protein